MIRHGQTPCVVINRFCGDHEAELTPEGRLMAEYVRGNPALDDVELMLSSPKKRAIDTAETIAKHHSMGVTVDNRLSEVSFGLWENQLPSELPDKGPHRAWEANPALFSPPGGETGLQVMARAVAAARDAAQQAKSVAIVSHKAPIRLIAAFFLGISPSRYRDIANVSCSSVSTLELQGSSVALKQLGDVSHLPAEWQTAPDQYQGVTKSQDRMRRSSTDSDSKEVSA
nr:histidine phosphatase family protein [Actinopolyspora biskrensis]